jgi:hypothetical protein
VPQRNLEQIDQSAILRMADFPGVQEVGLDTEFSAQLAMRQSRGNRIRIGVILEDE